MGKGKKFKDSVKKSGAAKLEEVPSISGLSLEEGEHSRSDVAASPSDVAKPTSTIAAAPGPVEEDEGGLGLGLGKNKKKKKKPVESSPALAAAPIDVAQPKPPTTTPSAPEPEPKVEEEDDGLGLGLGKSRKKKRKPKSVLAAADASGEHSKESTPAPSDSALQEERAKTWGPSKTILQPLQAPPSQGLPNFPPGFPTPAPLGFVQPQSQIGSPPQLVQSSFPGASSHTHPQILPESQLGLPILGRGEPLPPPQRQEPQSGFPGLSGQATVQSIQPSPQVGFRGQERPPQAKAPPGWQQPGAGRGRGRGQEQQAAAPVASAPGISRGPPQPRAVSSHGDVRKTPDAVSRFRIPDKIIGNMVPARPITVLANYLPMTIKPLKIHRYDVSFKPDKPKKMIPRAFNTAKGRLYPKHFIAFDQMKNCYSLMPLPNVPPNERFSTMVELLDNNGRKMNFEVSFKATGIVDLGTIINHIKNGGSSISPPTEAIQCIDVILRQGTLENYVKAGRQFFKRPDRPIDLGDGLEMWTGLFQSAIFTTRPFINIDVAHKGFPRQQSMINAISQDFRLDLNTPIDRQRSRGVEMFRVFIKNLRVMACIGGDSSTTGQKREFICNDLVDPPSRITFTMNDNGKDIQMTVADYFAKVKKVRLRYPNLNCMWVGPRDRNIYYPLELLEISYGQALNKQLNEMQLSTMVREAASPPNERMRKIQEVIRDMNYSRNEYFKMFGLEIQNEFIKVEARVLQAPQLDVGDRRTIQPVKGAWQANRLLKPEPLESWAIISIELDVMKCNGEHVIGLLKSQGNQLGMRVAEPMARYYNTDMRKLHDVLFEALKKEIRFLVIIVPTRGRDYYHRVKQVAEREIGVLTQCIRENTAVRRMNNQTAKNILLKVNSKLMGVNQALDRGSMPRCLAAGGVMVVGADVTHPSPDQTSLPSIAAVTASIDPKAFIYNIQLSIQTPKKEVIVEFEDMMVEHLKVYIKRQGGLPRKIFVFRDGVSEGQFGQVMDSELQAVHRAYQRMKGDNTKPEVLFLLVQKRHHTRFFNSDAKYASYNVEPGTVVDKHIVHARELDFYLVSHQAIKGTARPTRYHAVCNDGKIPHDEVEQLTYYLCHLYSRCMRAVSYPTPTYYAHLACLRARSLTYGEKFNNQDLEKHPKRLNVLDKMLEFSRMFFV